MIIFFLDIWITSIKYLKDTCRIGELYSFSALLCLQFLFTTRWGRLQTSCFINFNFL